jgi:hypothetical protein
LLTDVRGEVDQDCAKFTIARRTESPRPFGLDRTKRRQHRLENLEAARREEDQACTAAGAAPLEVTTILHLRDNVVYRLLRGAGAIGEVDRPHAFRMQILQERVVRGNVRETGRAQCRKHARARPPIVPRGAVHHFVNEDPAIAARGWVMFTPGKIGPAFFREAAAVINVAGPPDPVRVREVMLKHGLVPA